MSLGLNIKNIRKQKGLTQRELAELIGMTASTITKYENDQLEPSIETIGKIASVLKVSSLDLMPPLSSMNSINLDNYINVRTVKDENGVSSTRIISEGECIRRKKLKDLLMLYGLIDSDFEWDKIDLIENSLMLYLEILIKTINQ